MAHMHRMEDSDPHFQIDGDTRELTYTSPDKLTIIQHDHNSEIVTFDMPKEIDGHDMRDCDDVQVHFINTDVNYSGTFVKGSSPITDLHVSENDKDVLVFSWAIPRSATSLVGPLAFAVRFACTDGPDADYVWHTKVYAGMYVSTGLNVEGTAVEMVDHFQEWYDKLFSTYEENQEIVEELTKTVGDVENIEQALDAILAIQKELIGEQIIEFTFDSSSGVYTLQAVDGMTWGEWVDSEYNTIGISNGSSMGEYVGSIYNGINYLRLEGYDVFADDVIVANGQYTIV